MTANQTEIGDVTVLWIVFPALSCLSSRTSVRRPGQDGSRGVSVPAAPSQQLDKHDITAAVCGARVGVIPGFD